MKKRIEILINPFIRIAGMSLGDTGTGNFYIIELGIRLPLSRLASFWSRSQSRLVVLFGRTSYCVVSSGYLILFGWSYFLTL